MPNANVAINLNLNDRASKQLMAQANKIGKVMTAMGAAIIGTMALAIKSYADTGDEIAKLSKRTGLATETLSKLKYAADMSGSSISGLTTALQYTARTLNEAVTGSQTAIDSFTQLGMDFKSIQALKPEDQFLAIAGALSRITDPTKKQALAMEIWGRSGTELIPMLDDMTLLMAEAEKRGMIFSPEDAARAEAFNDAMTQVKTSMQSIFIEVVPPLIDALKPVIESISNIATQVRDWIKENPELAATIIKVIAVAGVLMTVLGPMLIMLPGIAAAIGFLVSPVGLVIAAIGALIAIGIVVWRNWDTIISGLKRLWESLPGPARFVFEALFDIIMAPVRAVQGLIEAIQTLWNMLGFNQKKTVVAVAGGGGYGEEINPFYGVTNREAGDWDYFRTEGPGSVVGGGMTSLGLEPMAEGGIVTSPTHAVIGEAGPEAVVPLSGGVVPLENVINLTLNLDGEPIAKNVMRHAGQLYMQRNRLGG